MQGIGLGEALSLWLSGRKLDGMALYGLSVVWWARLAKVATYAAGLTVVLDIIGPERLRAWGQRMKKRRVRFPLPALLAMLFVLALVEAWVISTIFASGIAEANEGLNLVVLAIGAVVMSVYFGSKLLPVIASILERPRLERVLRVGGLSVLSTAFFVDLLMS